MTELKTWIVMPKVDLPKAEIDRDVGGSFARVTGIKGKSGDMKMAAAALVEPVQALLDRVAGERVGNLEELANGRASFLSVVADEETAEKIRALDGVWTVAESQRVVRLRSPRIERQ